MHFPLCYKNTTFNLPKIYDFLYLCIFYMQQQQFILTVKVHLIIYLVFANLQCVSSSSSMLN